MTSKKISKDFFSQDTVRVARKLLGKIISYKNVSGMIVETEVYKGKDDGDKASHASRKTPRSAIMFDTFGKFYIYFVYGNYFCMNITTEKNKPGAVLIRALQPLQGIKIMARRRGIKTDNNNNNINSKGNIKLLTNLANGPGKLCQAMGITKKLNGTDVNDKIKLYDSSLKLGKHDIIAATRIGIKEAKHLKWRFYIKDNEFVSTK